MPRPTRLPRLALLAASAFLASACGGDDDGSDSSFVAVFGTFPAELQALVDRAEIDETRQIDAVTVRLGRLGGTRVVLTMTGIGLVNAETTTSIVLDHFDVSGVVVSGVAGSHLRLGDVAVPERWTFPDGEEYATDADWLERAGRLAAKGDVVLEQCAVLPEECTNPPGTMPGDVVCLPHQPDIFVGGLGRSSDPFGGAALECQEEPAVCADVFGCDIFAESLAANQVEQNPFSGPKTSAEPLASEDMETTAIVREAAARGLPFIAFRAVSDGEGDPLDLPGFPAQFFTYYRLSANNAAAAATAFLQTLGE